MSVNNDNDSLIIEENSFESKRRMTIDGLLKEYIECIPVAIRDSIEKLSYDEKQKILMTFAPTEVINIQDLVSKESTLCDSVLGNLFTGRELPFQHLNYNLGHIMKSFENGMLVPAIPQRDKCWPVKDQQNLIESICSGIPIGVMHFCRSKKDPNLMLIVDAYQRNSAIKDFINSRFSVNFIIKNGVLLVASYYADSSTKKSDIIPLHWKDICKNASSKDVEKARQYTTLKQNFESYGAMHILLWRSMTIDQQATLMTIINRSQPFSNDEHIYCTNCRTKVLLDFIISKYVDTRNDNDIYQGILRHCGARIKKHYRFKAYRFIHTILVYLSGTHFNSEPGNYKSFKLESIKESAQYFNKLLSDMGIETSDEMCEELMDKIGIRKLLENLRRTISALNEAIENKIGRVEKSLPVHKNVMRDAIMFLAEDMHNGKIQKATITSEFEKIYSLLIDYNESIQKEGGKVSQGSMDKGKIQSRRSRFEDIYNKLGLPDLNKVRKLSKVDVDTMKMRAVGTQSEINGAIITLDNGQLDHVQPCSLEETLDFKILHKDDNRNKSNFTQEGLENTLNYVKSATSQEEKK